MYDIQARIRTGTLPAQSGDRQQNDHRIRVDLKHLYGLEGRARLLSFLPRQPVRSALNGRHASRLRGRGLNFEEIRDYTPEDDVRSIDWKVTARTGKPHVRVFTEERDRPTLIVADQRMSMFFGSVLNMKSVTAAECAALAAFCVLAQGDRVGGIVFGDEIIAEIRPQRSRTALNRFLSALASANNLLKADAPTVDPIPLNSILQSIARIAPCNHLIVVFSDFDIVDENTQRLVSGLSRHNDIILGLISDPMAPDIPKGLKLVVSDGLLQAQIDTTDDKTHKALGALASGRLAEILDWQRRCGVSMLNLSSGENSFDQMCRLMGIRPK